ncbi:alanine or glycine:cation symporter, AGCS family [Clostridium collagenovorans DSM 3089]|uniref:Alanine or glycine:cation symporter, AGCS family n=1 Tax=Clostridium collagenovorans DSM 3089 TaxID=1121306 RepID=A0A1M5SC59_9CLOT|nr:sodium:alanine symporter family protein [Clostridium collagenovorans]SHH36030.1 alanine or glycine:cation symporter, AGCS family [Clostridium collagenovorans DSM 3089]
MEMLTNIVTTINKYLWDYILIFLLCGTGIYFTIKFKFVQVRKFGQSFKMTFGGIKFGKKAGKEGMSSFQALATSIAAQVGTGNLAGAATAIVAGGPGAIFWMWLSAFFGMGTIFAEASLAQKYKETVDGEVTGGPAYYIKNGLGCKWLAVIFSITIILALGFIGNMVQANSIGDAFSTAFNIKPVIVGIVVAILAGVIFIGGVSRIASFTEKIVPIMALFYIIGSVVIIAMNYAEIIPAFKYIFVGAFSSKAVVGGALGVGIKKAMRYGVARGLFSNEAGMGSTPHAHAVAKVNHPAEQGLVAMMGVFIDTFVILTLTALVIITSGALGATDAAGKTLTGISLTQKAFEMGMGNFGVTFIAIALLFFAFSTIIGWYFFGEANIKFLFGKKALTPYRILVMVFIVLGCVAKVDLVWDLADTFNGLMVLPNLVALLALGGVAGKLLVDYEGKKNKIGEKEKVKK